MRFVAVERLKYNHDSIHHHQFVLIECAFRSFLFRLELIQYFNYLGGFI